MKIFKMKLKRRGTLRNKFLHLKEDCLLVEYVCFANLSNRISGVDSEVGEAISIYEGENANLFLYPIENACDLAYQNIKYLNLASITSQRNPYCIEIKKGNIDIEIIRELEDRFVRVS